MRFGREDIICISSIDWDFIWQGHQEIMSTLARQGHRVLFVENTGVRAPGFKDLPRLRKRLKNWFRGVKGFRQERDNLVVYAPVILPFPYSRFARRINRALLIRAIQRWMRATGVLRPIVWTFLPTPLARDLIKAVEPSVTVYYCIDDLASSSPQARRIADSEVQVFQEADLVFVTSEKLRQRAARFNHAVHLFPFGVDYSVFEQVRTSSDDMPAELRTLPRPVLGYIGGIHQWVDQDLLVSVAQRLPQASFVLVGPPQTDLTKLRQLSNIHLMGPRSHAEVPRYAKGFDVGLIPYRLSDYTGHVYPTKLNEYLAMGLPVVATDLPEIRRFNQDHGDIVEIAGDADHFAQAITTVLTQTSAEAIQRRIKVSQRNSWQARIGQMWGLVEDVLADRPRETARWQETLGRVYRKARHRALRIGLGVSVAYVLLFRSPVVWWIAEPLRASAPTRHADAIVVVAGGVGETGKAGGGGGYQERVKQAVDLYQSGVAPHIVFSSGFTFVFREAEVMKGLATSLGVPAEAILLETNAANTWENVTHVAPILRTHGWGRILLVSSPYHMRRALLTWHAVAPDIDVIPTPVSRSQFYAHGLNEGPTLEQLRALVHEYVAILYYRWKSWI